MTKWIIYLLWSLISIKWLQIEFVSQKSFLLMWSQQLCHRYCSGPNNLWNWHNWRINEWKVWRMYCHISYVSHFNDETSCLTFQCNHILLVSFSLHVFCYNLVLTVDVIMYFQIPNDPYVNANSERTIVCPIQFGPNLKVLYNERSNSFLSYWWRISIFSAPKSIQNWWKMAFSQPKCGNMHFSTQQ